MGRYDGFDEFVHAQRSALSRTAYFLAGGTESDAEDLLQEALTRTAARWSRVRAKGDPTAYVRTVMLNHVRSTWRRHRTMRILPVPLVPDRPALEPPAGEGGTGSLLQALRTLPPRQRAVLYLRYCEDLSEVDTARLLGCSVGTVKSQAHSGLQRLRVLAPFLADQASGSENEVRE